MDMRRPKNHKDDAPHDGPKRTLRPGALAWILGLNVYPGSVAAQEPTTDSKVEASPEAAPDDSIAESKAEEEGKSEQDNLETGEAEEIEQKSVESEGALEAEQPIVGPDPGSNAPSVAREAQVEKIKKVESAVAARTYKPWEEVGDTQYDWIRTTSGEWLKGELKDLRDEDLRIDSDEFDLQTLSWGDISDLHSPNRFTYVLVDQTVFTGSAEMADGKLVVNTDAGPHAFDRKRLMTIVPESTKEIEHWSFKLTFGMTMSAGNSDVVDYSAYSRIRREDPFNRVTVEYTGMYGLVSDEVNTNRHRGAGAWNIFISPVFYITPGAGEFLYDRFQNIQLRAMASTGVGFHAVNTSDVALDLELAAGYVSTRFISVEAGVADNQKDGLAIPRLVLEWDISEDVEFELDWTTALGVPDIENSFHRGHALLSIDITDIFNFDVSAVYSRQESPVTDEEGVTPQKDDITMTVGIGVDID